MKVLQVIVDWIVYINEWFAYGAKCSKVVVDTTKYIRDNWPATPSAKVPKGGDGEEDTKDTGIERSIPTHGEVLGGD